MPTATSTCRPKQGVAGLTWTVSPTSILEFRFGGDYSHNGKLPSTVGQPTAGFTIPNEPLDPSFAGGLISSSVSGFSQFGRQGSNPQYQYPLVYDPKVNFTKIHGRHSLKMGFEFQLIDTDVSDFNPKYGQLSLRRLLQRPVLLHEPVVSEQPQHHREAGLRSGRLLLRRGE